MNPADIAITNARKTIRDFRTLATEHSELMARVDDADRRDWYLGLTEEECQLVDRYQALRVKAALAQRTLDVYEVEL